jgi:hypothetical protein
MIFNDGRSKTQGQTLSDKVSDVEDDPILLDLRRGGRLPAGLLRRLDEIMVRDVAIFNDTIAHLSLGREHDVDWWMCRPTTRNNHVSILHARCMQLTLIRELAHAGTRVHVLLDCPVMANVLRRSSLPNLTIHLNGTMRNRLRRLTTQITGILASVFHCSAAAFAAWQTRKPDPALPGTPLTVINTFVSIQSVRGGQYHDGYFPEMIDSLEIEKRGSCRYLPVFYRMRNYPKAFRILRENPITFLFYEDHLDMSDYLFAFGVWWRLGKFRRIQAHYAGFEVGPLFELDLQTGRFASIVVRALLAHRFHLRARERGIHIRTVLDWYEGLDYNHAVASAVQWYNPDTSITGFRSAGSLYYMSCTPAPHEVVAGVTPRRMAVVGTRQAREIKNLCPQLNVIDAPGLRYRALSTLKREPVEGGGILLALPLSAPLAADNVRTMVEARALIANPPRHWWIKSHPVLPESEVIRLLGGKLPEGMEFVRGDFYAWLRRVDLVLGTSSSALMESIARGVATICIASGNVPTENPIPSWISPDLGRVTYGAQETAQAISEMIKTAICDQELHQIQEGMLGVVTDASVRQLLEID